MILLDTSVLSRVFRRKDAGPDEMALRASVARLLSSETPLALPAPVLQEILTGIRSAAQFASLEQHLLGAFGIVHPGTRDYVAAARLSNRCRAAGLNVGGGDCLIAALAIDRRCALLAIDADFEHIARLAPLKLHRWRGR